MVSMRALVVAVALTVAACGGYAPPPENSAPVQPLYGMVCTSRLPEAHGVIPERALPLPALTRVCGASYPAGYLPFE